MKHEEIINRLIFYLEGDLPVEEKNEVEMHVKDCKLCRLYLQELQQDLSLLQKEKYTQADPYFYTRLKAKMESADSRPSSQFKRLLQPALFSLLLIVSVGIGIKVGQQIYHDGVSKDAEVLVLLPIDGLQEEPIEQFLLNFE